MKTLLSLWGSRFIRCTWLIVLAALVGCKPAPMTNTIVTEARSPDGGLDAVLVERYLHAALSSNGFFLIIIPAEQRQTEAINARNIGEWSALIATRAGRVQLRWQDNSTLLVLCESCGLQAIDISKKLDHVGSTKIIYQGFPGHIAYR